MPVLKKIIVNDFRNISFQELEFSPNLNCISGNNGMGKTNLLDAVHYVSMCKSAFPTPDKANIRHGCASFAISGTCLQDDGIESVYSMKYSSEGKSFLRDGKAYRRLSEHIGRIPVVMVSPSDISMVSDSGEERRRFANAVISQIDRNYLSSLQAYGKLLSQRNTILKSETIDFDLLDVLDRSLSQAAVPIYEGRKLLAQSLGEAISSYYSLISGGAEQVSIEYDSALSEASLYDILQSRRERDIFLHYTGAGIQRDDFTFKIDGFPLRSCGSQGQQKSFLVALKFAQYDMMRRSSGYAPLLLLDDVFDKLDVDRISNLISMVAGNGFGQIFISDCNRERIRSIVDGITSDRAYFSAENGVFEKEA